jgi:rhodanese-related sulfurtransferase
MGLLERIANRLAGRDTGNKRTAPAPVAAPPRMTSAPVSAPAPVARKVAVAKGEEGPVADGAALATIEAGCQEVRERVEAGEPVTVVDVREPHETAGGIIPGARLIPLGELQTRWTELKDCNEIVCYCAAGARSYGAATFLREKGLFNATSLEGGFAAWTQIGGKVARPG